MNRRLLFLPFAGVVVLAGYLGWQMGKPVSESAVLDHYAAIWVMEGPAGAKETDCHGLPGDTPDVWMVIVCNKGDFARRTPVDRNGKVVTAQMEPDT